MTQNKAGVDWMHRINAIENQLCFSFNRCLVRALIFSLSVFITCFWSNGLSALKNRQFKDKSMTHVIIVEIGSISSRCVIYTLVVWFRVSTFANIGTERKPKMHLFVNPNGGFFAEVPWLQIFMCGGALSYSRLKRNTPNQLFAASNSA